MSPAARQCIARLIRLRSTLHPPPGSGSFASVISRPENCFANQKYPFARRPSRRGLGQFCAKDWRSLTISAGAGFRNAKFLLPSTKHGGNQIAYNRAHRRKQRRPAQHGPHDLPQVSMKPAALETEPSVAADGVGAVRAGYHPTDRRIRCGFGRRGVEWGAKQGGLMTMRAFNFLAGGLDIEFKVATTVLTGGFANHGLAFRNGFT
ncbi:MAG: hypothetical protein ACLP7I_18180 [Limisphaerales bacterium]